MRGGDDKDKADNAEEGDGNENEGDNNASDDGACTESCVGVCGALGVGFFLFLLEVGVSVGLFLLAKPLNAVAVVASRGVLAAVAYRDVCGVVVAASAAVVCIVWF